MVGVGYLLAAAFFTWPAVILRNVGVIGGNWGEEGAFLWNLWMVQRWFWEGKPLWHSSMGYGWEGFHFFVHTHTFTYGLIAAWLKPILELPTIYNWLMLMSFTVASMTCFALARALGIGRVGAFAAGLVFSFTQHRLGQVAGHPNIVAMELLPLGVLCVFRLARWRAAASPLRWWMLWCVGFLYSIYCGYYPGIYYLIASAGSLAMCAALAPARVLRQFHRPATWMLPAVAAPILLALCWPIVSSWIAIHSEWRSSPTEGSYVNYPGINWETLLLPSSHQWLGRMLPIAASWRAISVESEAYLGIAALLLVVMAFTGGAKLRAAFRGALLATFVLLLLFASGGLFAAFGRESAVVGPYKLLDHVPVLKGLRVPGRLMLVAALPWALLAGLGAQALLSRRGGKYALLALLLLFAVEHKRGLPVSQMRDRHELPKKLLRGIAKAPLDGSVVIAPLDYKWDSWNLFQMLHGKPSHLLFLARNDSWIQWVFSGRDIGLPRGHFVETDKESGGLQVYDREFDPEVLRTTIRVQHLRWVLIPPVPHQRDIAAWFIDNLPITRIRTEIEEELSWMLIEIDLEALPDDIQLLDKEWRHQPADVDHVYDATHIIGDHARFVFWLSREQAIGAAPVLEIHGSSLPPRMGDLVQQELHVRWNGAPVPRASTVLRPEHSGYLLSMEGAPRRHGWNELLLEFPHDMRPANTTFDSVDQRRLPMLVYQMKLDFPDSPAGAPPIP